MIYPHLLPTFLSMCAWIRFYQNKQLWSKQRRGAAKWWRTHQCNLTMCKNIFMHKRFSNFFVFSKNMTSVTWRQFSPDFCDIYSSHLLCSAAQWFLQELHFFPSMKYEGGAEKGASVYSLQGEKHPGKGTLLQKSVFVYDTSIQFSLHQVCFGFRALPKALWQIHRSFKQNSNH